MVAGSRLVLKLSESDAQRSSEALGHATRRETFGRPIAEYQAVQWMLADMATELDAARMLVYKAAVAKDQQEQLHPRSLDGQARRLGSGPSWPPTRLCRSWHRSGIVGARRLRGCIGTSRATELYQGTSEVQRMIIAAHVIAS